MHAAPPAAVEAPGGASTGSRATHHVSLGRAATSTGSMLVFQLSSPPLTLPGMRTASRRDHESRLASGRPSVHVLEPGGGDPRRRLGSGHVPRTRRRVAAAGPDRRGGADASHAVLAFVDAKEVGVFVLCRRDAPLPLLQSVLGRYRQRLTHRHGAVQHYQQSKQGSGSRSGQKRLGTAHAAAIGRRPPKRTAHGTGSVRSQHRRSPFGQRSPR